jgi:hypothetical protein
LRIVEGYVFYPSTDGDTAKRSRVTATLARRPGATKARVEGALTYGQRDPKMKAVVK